MSRTEPIPRFLVISLLLATTIWNGACVLSISSTQNPSVQPTLISQDNFDWETLLVEPGDLPSGWTEGEISNTSNFVDDYDDVLQAPDSIIGQRFDNDGGVGGVTVLVYKSQNDLIITWRNILKIWRLSPPEGGSYVEEYEGIGERAAGLVGGGEMIFTRCNVLVHISSETKFDIGEYAVRLDRRLQSVVCQTP
jgi:hypothetical protein